MRLALKLQDDKEVRAELFIFTAIPYVFVYIIHTYLLFHVTQGVLSTLQCFLKQCLSQS